MHLVKHLLLVPLLAWSCGCGPARFDAHSSTPDPVERVRLPLAVRLGKLHQLHGSIMTTHCAHSVLHSHRRANHGGYHSAVGVALLVLAALVSFSAELRGLPPERTLSGSRIVGAVNVRRLESIFSCVGLVVTALLALFALLLLDLALTTA